MEKDDFLRIDKYWIDALACREHVSHSDVDFFAEWIARILPILNPPATGQRHTADFDPNIIPVMVLAIVRSGMIGGGQPPSVEQCREFLLAHISSTDNRDVTNPAMKPDNLFERTLVYEHAWEYSQALICIELIITQSPGLASIWQKKGDVLQKLDRVDEAINAYEKAIILNPAEPSAWFQKGMALLRLNRIQDARAFFHTFHKDYSSIPDGRDVRELIKSITKQIRGRGVISSLCNFVKSRKTPPSAMGDLGNMGKLANDVDRIKSEHALPPYVFPPMVLQPILDNYIDSSVQMHILSSVNRGEDPGQVSHAYYRDKAFLALYLIKNEASRALEKMQYKNYWLFESRFPGLAEHVYSSKGAIYFANATLMDKVMNDHDFYRGLKQVAQEDTVAFMNLIDKFSDAMLMKGSKPA